jgi:aminomethyltransferase
MSQDTPLRRTPLFASHLALNARLVPFAGWEMPVQYAGVVAEVKAVREAVGIFDVSHMGRARIEGAGAFDYLQHLVVSDVAALGYGRGQYSLLCHATGGIVDDVIVYRLGAGDFRIIFNAGNREKDLAWMRAQAAGFAVSITDISDETALIAVQGPQAIALLGEQAAALPRFGIGDGQVGGVAVAIARTGYTGEDGAELVCKADHAAALWDALRSAGAVPCGLGARDALRLEAALPLYGHEMDDSVNPYEARLGWVVKLDKDAAFVGKEALRAHKAAGSGRKLVGIAIDGRGVPREGYAVVPEPGDGWRGVVTSGTFSPTLGKGIALARVPSSVRIGQKVAVVIRESAVAATVTALPFVKNV